MTRRALWTEELFRLLEDGPKPIQELVMAASLHVPPAVAFRRWRSNVERKSPHVLAHRSPPDPYLTGARSVVSRTLHTKLSSGQFERRGDLIALRGTFTDEEETPDG